MPSRQSPVRGIRRLHSRLARFEANIARSSDSGSGVFLSNVASGRVQRNDSSSSSGRPSSSRRSSIGAIDSNTLNNATIRTEDSEVRVKDVLDASNHCAGTNQLPGGGRVGVRIPKSSGDKNDFGVHTTHPSRTNSSELVPSHESTSERAQSAPRGRRDNSGAAEVKREGESRRSAVLERREIFERRSSAATGTTATQEVPSTSQRRASTASNTTATAPTPNFPTRLVRRLGHFVSKRGSCGPGVSVSKAGTASRPSEYGYDYNEVKDKWSSRASRKKNEMKKVEDVDLRKRKSFLNRLKRCKRQQNAAEPRIVKSVQRRGSTGKMAGLKSVEKHKTTDRVKAGHKHSGHSRHNGKHSGKHTKHNKGSKKIHRGLIRRNSMGNTRLADEPVVALYWNPARERLLDPVAVFDDGTRTTEETAEESPPNMYDRGIVQRRASTGRIRLAEEDTTWLYAREDHEIDVADVRGSRKHKKHHKNKKSKTKVKAAKEALLSQLSPESTSKAVSLRRKMSVAPIAKSVPTKQDDPTEADPTNDDPSDDDTTGKPKRRKERRGSTGAVPFVDEADSRLHRKKKMRQEHKRRRRATNLSREGKVVKPDVSGESRPKASLLGLLDPSVALDDGKDDPSSWLAGDEQHVFTIAPYKPPPPKYRKTQKMTPRELELDLDGDSSDEESDDDFATQFFSSRPGTSRGKSFSAKAKDDPTQTTENLSDDDEDDDDCPASFFGGRPGATRGTSFMKKKETPEPVMTQRRESDSDDDDDCPVSFFGGRPGATRGTSFMEKKETTEAVKTQKHDSDSDDNDSCPASFFGGRPRATRGMSFMKKRETPEPIAEEPPCPLMPALYEDTTAESPQPTKNARKSLPVSTEPKSPTVTKVKDKKSRGPSGKTSSSSHNAPGTPKTPSKKKKTAAPAKSSSHKKPSSSAEKGTAAPKTPSKTKKVSTSRPPRSPTKSPEKQPRKAQSSGWEFKMVSPSRTLHGSPAAQVVGRTTGASEQMPLAPALEAATATSPDKPSTHAKRRRASTSAIPSDFMGRSSSSHHTTASVSSGASFGGEDRHSPPSHKTSAKSDKRLLETLTLISQADQSEVLEALHQLGDGTNGSPAVGVLQGELLDQKKDADAGKKKSKHGRKGKKTAHKAKTKG